MHLKWNGLVLASLCAASALLAADVPQASALPPQTEIIPAANLTWHDDYSAAYQAAKTEQKQLFIVFKNADMADFEKTALRNEKLLPLLNKLVRVMLPLDAAVQVPATEGAEPKSEKLLDQPAFAQMYKKPGFAIVDLTDEKSAYYGHVVSAHPLNTVYQTNENLLRTVLNLPKGSATQRALVLAVASHPEAPQSITGAAEPFLMEQSRHHSQLMVNYGSVGHHDWGTRAAEVSARLGSPSEVASMGSSENILEAAREAVDLWRSSGVHWGMVSSPHQYYGYDMVRSPYGGWYATGLFAN